MNTLAWIWIVISLLTQGGMPVFQQRLMSRTQGVNNAAVHGLISSSMIATLLLAAFVIGIGFSPPQSWHAISWHLVGMTVFYTAAHLCIFQSMRFINPSLFAAIFTARVIVIVAAAVFFLNEVFSALKGLGVIVIVGGILVSSYARSKKTQTTTSKDEPLATKPLQGSLFALLGTVFFGIASAIDAEVVKTFSPPSYLLFRLALPVLLVIVVGKFFLKVKLREIPRFINRERLMPLLGMSICLVISSATFMLAYLESRQLAFISGIHQVSLFATIGFSTLVNHEERRQFPLYALAAIICFGGILLLRWG